MQTFLCIIGEEEIPQELDGAVTKLSLSGNKPAYIRVLSAVKTQKQIYGLAIFPYRLRMVLGEFGGNQHQTLQ